MKRALMFTVVPLVIMLTGCGNVYLTGEALKMAEISTIDAYGAVQRVDPCENCGGTAAVTTQPAADAWVREYLRENFKQWRWFVRSARKDLTWGPKLEGE